MSLMSSDIKLSQEVDPSIRRWQAASTRDLEQLYLLLTQGLGGFSNQSPGSISQDVNTDGMGVEGNQGDYRFSGPASLAQVANAVSVDTTLFMRKANNLSDVAANATANENLGVPFSLGTYTKSVYTTAGAATHTFDAASKVYFAIAVGGGGGGGGGTTATASTHKAGSGGGSGAAFILSGRVNVATLDLVVGSKGSGGAVDNSGTDGTASTLTHDASTIVAAYGSGGSVGGNGGLGGTSAAISTLLTSDFFVVSASGRNGECGFVTQITYNGTGNVSSYTTLRGLGGYPPFLDSSLSGNGSGGSGGSAGGAGVDGSVGGIVIYER